MKTKLKLFARLLLLSTFSVKLSTLQAQSTAFTYQGRLNDGGSLARGSYDLRFAIYDAVTNGNLVAGPATNAPTADAHSSNLQRIANFSSN